VGHLVQPPFKERAVKFGEMRAVVESQGPSTFSLLYGLFRYRECIKKKNIAFLSHMHRGVDVDGKKRVLLSPCPIAPSHPPALLSSILQALTAFSWITLFYIPSISSTP